MEEDKDTSSNDNDDDGILQTPISNVRIISHDNLEVTLSKSCIGLLGELGKVCETARRRNIT